MIRQPIIITAKADPLFIYLKKVWASRILMVALAKRDLKAKYAQTALGVLWSLLQPLTGLLIFTFFFQRVIPIGDKIGYPYSIFAFIGMTSWYYFSFNVTQGGMALMQSQDLIKKIYFPKLVLPLSKALVGLGDFFTSLLLLLIIMLIEGYVPSWKIIFLPFFLLLNAITGLSVSLWLSALTIRYRDFQHILPYLINFGIWLTPVFYPGTLIPSQYSYLLYLNPMAGVIEGFRWCLMGESAFLPAYWVGISVAVVLFVGGLLFFQKMEDQLSDWL